MRRPLIEAPALSFLAFQDCARERRDSGFAIRVCRGARGAARGEEKTERRRSVFASFRPRCPGAGPGFRPGLTGPTKSPEPRHKSEVLQFLCENQKSVLYSLRRARFALAPRATPLGEQRAERIFLLFPRQPIEKSRFGRIKPSKTKHFCLDWLGLAWTYWPPGRRRAGSLAALAIQ
jgi:hypothetical protein